MKKKCTKCGEWKEVSEFYHDRTQKDGLKSYCIACEKEYKNAVRAKADQARLEKMRETHHGELLELDSSES